MLVEYSRLPKEIQLSASYHSNSFEQFTWHASVVQTLDNPHTCTCPAVRNGWSGADIQEELGYLCSQWQHSPLQFAVLRQQAEVKTMHKHVSHNYSCSLKRNLRVMVVLLRWRWSCYWRNSPAIISGLIVAVFGYGEINTCCILKVILYLVLL